MKKVAIYARVSTPEQDAAAQIEACRAYCRRRDWEVGKEVVETASSKDTRPKKETLLSELRRGQYDALVLFRLDRWARSLSEMVGEIEMLQAMNVEVVSLHESVDTSNAMGRAMLQLIGVFAQLERDLISERTKDRLAALKRMGKRLGRPKKVNDAMIEQMHRERMSGKSYQAVGAAVGVSEHTARRYLTVNGQPATKRGPPPTRKEATVGSD